MKKLKLAEGFRFGTNGVKAIEVSSKKDIESGNVVYIEVKGEYDKTKTTLSDRFYFILEGKGEFISEDETIGVEKDDLIIIPKNTIYFYRGEMKLILFNTPAFN